MNQETRAIHERRWKAWRKLATAANEIKEAYSGELDQPHWISWAQQLEKECKEHEDVELNFMTGHSNPLDLPLER